MGRFLKTYWADQHLPIAIGVFFENSGFAAAAYGLNRA